ncbi:hypothetical protein F5050DRAFT_51780 [Lentinula boryana]|uniref:Uncharacterized protein n=1 Tax=Lentinula boryana TaxID=40481 RepID=A0ABQ8QE84_9AGAR|nr:hypothetical protein F5050DRAFT_51780 [Lentinula boryana]
MDFIWDAIVKQDEGDQVDTFLRLMKSPNISATTLAAYYYDGHYHSYFYSGRVLPCYRMTAKRDFASDHANADVVQPRERKRDRTETPRLFRAFQYIHGLFQLCVQLEEIIYYIPRTQNFPAFDSMWAKTKEHVVLIQATVSRRHSVSEAGLWWLLDLGVKTVEYMFLSPLSINTASIPLPAMVPPSLKYPVLVDYPDTIIPRLSSPSPSRSPSPAETSIRNVRTEKAGDVGNASGRGRSKGKGREGVQSTSNDQSEPQIHLEGESEILDQPQTASKRGVPSVKVFRVYHVPIDLRYADKLRGHTSNKYKSRTKRRRLNLTVVGKQ